MRALGFDPLAAKDRVVVAYPDGLDGSWNDGRATASTPSLINSTSMRVTSSPP